MAKLPAKATTALVGGGRQLPADENPCAVYLSSLSENGQRAMQGRLRGVAEMLGCEDLRQVAWHKMRYQHVQAVVAALRRSGQAPATVNLSLAALRGVAKAAMNLGHMTAEEYQRVMNVPLMRGERVPSGRALPPGEIAALMDACAKDEGPAGVRDAAIIGLLFAGGLRRAELVTLDLADYDGETRKLLVRGKGNKQREIFVNDGAADALADWVIVRGDEDGPLFVPINKGGALQYRRMSTQAVYNMLHKRADEAKVKPPTPHDFRRTFVSELLDRGADIAVVQRLAGHANIQTTARYDRRGDEVLKKAVGLLHLPYQRRELTAEGAG